MALLGLLIVTPGYVQDSGKGKGPKRDFSTLFIAISSDPVIRNVPFTVQVAVLDKKGELDKNFSGEVSLETSGASNLPTSLSFSKGDGGFKEIPAISFSTIGDHLIVATASGKKGPLEDSLSFRVIPNIVDFPCPDIFGDLDLDGTLTGNDVSILLDILNGDVILPTQCAEIMVGDIDGDGVVSNADAVALAAIVATGVDGEFNFPGPNGDDGDVIPIPGDDDFFPCLIEPISPLPADFVRRSQVRVQFEVTGVVSLAVNGFGPSISICANRPVGGKTTSKVPPGTDLVRAFPGNLRVLDDGTFFFNLVDMLPIGETFIQISCRTELGAITCLTYNFTVTGIDISGTSESVEVDSAVSEPGRPGIMIAATVVEPGAEDVAVTWEKASPSDVPGLTLSPTSGNATVYKVPAGVVSDDEVSQVNAIAQLSRTIDGVAVLDSALASLLVQPAPAQPRYIGLFHSPFFPLPAPSPRSTVVIRVVTEIPTDATGPIWEAQFNIFDIAVTPPPGVKRNRVRIGRGVRNRLTLTFLAGSTGEWDFTLRVRGGFNSLRPNVNSVVPVNTLDADWKLFVNGPETQAGQPTLFNELIRGIVNQLRMAQAELDRLRAQAPAIRAKPVKTADEQAILDLVDKLDRSNRIVFDFSDLLNCPAAFELGASVVFGSIGAVAAYANGRPGFRRDAGNNINGYTFETIQVGPSAFTRGADALIRTIIHELIHCALFLEVNQLIDGPSQLSFSEADGDGDGLEDTFRDPRKGSTSAAGAAQQENVAAQMTNELMDAFRFLRGRIR